jgi:hypothetical protein
VSNHAFGRPRAVEGLEDQTHCLLDLFVRIEDEPLLGVTDESYRRPHPQLTSACLVELTAEQPSTQYVQLRLAHRPLQTE